MLLILLHLLRLLHLLHLLVLPLLALLRLLLLLLLSAAVAVALLLLLVLLVMVMVVRRRGGGGGDGGAAESVAAHSELLIPRHSHLSHSLHGSVSPALPSYTFDDAAVSNWDVASSQFVVTKGQYTVSVADSAADVKLTATFTV
jgi:hypothetical protein